MNPRHLVTFAMLVLSACSQKDQRISEQLSALVGDTRHSTVDLSAIGPPDWDRVCFLHPYIINEKTKKILGFEWNSTLKSSIGSNDAIYALVFVSDQHVIAFTEHPRSNG